MENLESMAAEELVALHNERAAEADRIEPPWKRSKDELVARIRALGGQGSEEPEAAAPAGVRTLAERLLTDPEAAGLTYGELAERVRQAAPGSRTTARSVAWYASRLRRRGVELPRRPRSKRAAD